MSELLTAEGYEQTKEKLRDLQARWRRSRNARTWLRRIWRAFGDPTTR